MVNNDDLKAILEFLQAGQKIEAIKAYERATGCGLTEAKEAVEEMARQMPPSVSDPSPFWSKFRVHYGNLSAGFLLFGIIFAGWAAWVGISGFETEKWPTTEGVILRSGIASSGRPGWRPEIYYEYQVNGKTFKSERVAFAVSYGFSRAVQTVDSYPVGRRVTVYYKPNNPSSAALEPGIPPIAYIMLSAGLLCLWGFRWAHGKQ